MNLISKTVFVFLASLVLITGCKDSDDDSISGFSVDATEFVLGAEGGIKTVKIVSPARWIARSDQPWIKISPANGIGEVTCQIYVDTTLTNNVRTSTVSFIPQGLDRKEIAISQTGFGKIITLDKSEVEVANMGEYGKRYFDISVVTNVDFKVEIPSESQSWLKLEKMPSGIVDGSARPRSAKLRFLWEMNTNPEDRLTDVRFLPVNEGDKLESDAVLAVRQQAAPLIADSRQGDSLALIIIKEKFKSVGDWDTSEKMDFWDGITLWEKTDKGVKPEMVGRVRSASFTLIALKEVLPVELSKLKYLEKLFVQGNANKHILPDVFELGTALSNLEYLKDLRLISYGITTIDPAKELTKPMKTLEVLSLRANNLASFPSEINSRNFPNLIALDLGGNRRFDSRTDIRDGVWENNWGMRVDVATLTDLFSWDNLKALSLSFGYLYGELPAMDGPGARYYTAADIAANDTLKSASPENQQRLMTEIPKVLPNLEELSINLNFLTGKVPDWLLYHPRLNRFAPFILVFSQESGYTPDGKVPGFVNEPINMDYFYEFYPAAKPKLNED
jgi:hypothetical protein